MNSDSTRTECAKLTAAGRGAIAVVAIAGDYQRMLADCFQPASRKHFADLLQQKIVYGVWTTSGEDVVVYNRGTKLAEVHCHGGTAAVDAIVTSLVTAGATEVEAGKFQRHIVTNAWERDVQDALQTAFTEKTARFLLPQIKQLPAAIEQILHSIARNEVDQAGETIQSILDWSEFGTALTEVPSVVFCGQPNVGKSSLINAVAGFERAIVHDTPGTTRDVLNQQTAVNGWPINMKDTAGLRDAVNVIEQIGIENARQQIKSARLIVGIFDASQAWSSDDQQLVESLNCDLLVHNKADIAIDDDSRPPGLSTSATKRQGIPQLIDAVARLLYPKLPPAGQTFCVNRQQQKTLCKTLTCLESGEAEAAVNCLLRK